MIFFPVIHNALCPCRNQNIVVSSSSDAWLRIEGAHMDGNEVLQAKTSKTRHGCGLHLNAIDPWITPTFKPCKMEACKNHPFGVTKYRHPVDKIEPCSTMEKMQLSKEKKNRDGLLNRIISLNSVLDLIDAVF